MMKIPEATIRRFSMYMRALAQAKEDGNDFVSSRDLSKRLGFSDAQIRRDLNYIGTFGRAGKGYKIDFLTKRLSELFGIDKKAWDVALVGMGNLGGALARYKGFGKHGFTVAAVFDSDEKKIGKTIDTLRIEDTRVIPSVIRRRKIPIAIIATPASSAQQVADELIKGGVKTILNFAPTRIYAPEGVRVKNVDLSIELENLSFYLNAKKK
ncbi:MAG: redox-sensing transcriptional repressor Rex [Candidatus Omnitrophica bacterium]|nr:redox-sensing transcriptional repressor Rex [Candidatus Omnitrophota bacterium]